MATRLGDKVRFLNENLEGTVTSLLKNGMLGVTVDDDFEIPVLEGQVVKIAFEPAQVENKTEVLQEKPRRLQVNPLGIFLAFERYTETSVQVWLHNNFCDLIHVVLYEKNGPVYKYLQSFRLERDDTLPIGKADMTEFDQWPSQLFQIVCVEQNTIKPPAPIVRQIDFQAKTFHQSLKHVFFINKQAYVYRLDEVLVQTDLTKLKERDFTETPKQSLPDLKQRPEEVIDLHYEALLLKGFPVTTDVTALQMDVFVKSMESAFVHQMKRIVFIHGVGNGYLRNKLHTWLSKHKEMKTIFGEADPLRFGDGATEVNFL